jgi:hypothetical protein
MSRRQQKVVLSGATILVCLSIFGSITLLPKVEIVRARETQSTNFGF